MSATTDNSAKESYTFQRPSSAATRALVAETSNPSSSPEFASSSSNDVEIAQKPTLQRKLTDNYERAAAAEAAKSNTSGSATTSDATTDRPGVQRQQSWQMRDFKGAHQGQMLAREAGHGYSSTEK